MIKTILTPKPNKQGAVLTIWLEGIARSVYSFDNKVLTTLKNDIEEYLNSIK